MRISLAHLVHYNLQSLPRSATQSRTSVLPLHRSSCLYRSSIVLFVFALWSPTNQSSADAIDADSLPDIVDRNYAIDIYQGVVYGTGKSAGMGGVAVATGQGSANMSANPAAPAIRTKTSSGTWDFDWRIEGIANLSTDFDNNGIEIKRSEEPITGLSLGLQYGKWGIGFDVTALSNQFDAPEGSLQNTLVIESDLVRLAIARRLPHDVTVGMGVKASIFSFYNGEGVVDITGGAAEFGAIWSPSFANLRVGAAASLSVEGTEVEADDSCDPQNCGGYILPNEASVPWRVSGGIAWRFSNSKWNEIINKRFFDERNLTLAVDLVATGPTSRGHNFEAFGLKKLQRSGRKTVFSLRGGAESELLPGRLRLRAGSYWEPARVQDTRGRLHGTAGIDVRVWSLGKYRFRVSANADIARNYSNIGFSAGFWN